MFHLRFLGSPVLVAGALAVADAWGAGEPGGNAAGDVFVQAASGIILLDGVDTGVRAPGVLGAVSVGPHVVRVVDNCRVGEARVSVQADLVERVEIALAEGVGTLRVRSPAPEARILVDGVEAGRAAQGDLTVACGDHRVVIEAEGYHPRKVKVQVALGQVVEVEGDLLPEGAAQPVRRTATGPKIKWLNVGIDAALVGATVGLAAASGSSWSRMQDNYDAYTAMHYDEEPQAFYADQVQPPGRTAQVLALSSLGTGLGAVATFVFLPIRTERGE
jgi:hypothetical protein